ncbi:dTDP-4-dehydrorhamnose reductase [Pseudomonas duriflava]|uniref:dTDP-4-dehydrorhamnose reductase n=1 Tax=Pseudomonas duriflava TaxID=459528 RepID=A0A562Q3W2_9PSED|nr:sugar nucleotide-binding protein [Pseudomonas duriflava]TWI50840.1 dTDP-4-dehydrorhamnose reductase [Pseudomonas duriflava]
MRMRLMLLGGGNALGQALIRLGAEEDIYFLAPRPPAQGWDASHLTRLLDDTRPDAVINLAYYFDWFQAELPDDEHLFHQARAVERLAELCQHYALPLIQPSSYRIFDGGRTSAYSEKDDANPLGVRGQALWTIEQSVRALCPRHILLRLGWLLDESSQGWLDRFLRRVSLGERLCLADDRRGSPTPVDDAARVILAIIKQLDCAAPLWGTYHYGGVEAVTQLTLGHAILAEAGALMLLPEARLEAQAHTQAENAAEEPQNAVLTCKKILNTFGIKPRNWRSELPAVLERYYRQIGNRNA